MRRSDRAREEEQSDFRSRSRAAVVVAVGQSEGADQRWFYWRAEVRARRTVATSLSPGLRKLALRHQPRRQLDSRRTDSLFRFGPLVPQLAGQSAKGVRHGQ